LIGATDYRSGPYDLICFFDALHDMGDPERVIANARANLAPGGTVMVVEPSAAERLSDAVGDPVSRLYYAGSSMICTPSALSQGHTALGNQVSDETWRVLFGGAGFRYFERAAETPFNRVFQARV
jgi:hypothetical protein